MFFSLISYTGIRRTQEGVFESSLWKFDRPPLGLLAFPKQLLHGGCGFDCLPKFRFDGRVFRTAVAVAVLEYLLSPYLGRCSSAARRGLFEGPRPRPGELAYKLREVTADRGFSESEVVAQSTRIDFRGGWGKWVSVERQSRSFQTDSKGDRRSATICLGARRPSQRDSSLAPPNADTLLGFTSKHHGRRKQMCADFFASPNVVGNRMDCEANIGSIRALDEQIRDHERVIIELKRTRNSLLNVSKIPPEILGKIFRWNVTRRGDFGGLGRRSHNFLVVCHHWYEVASQTPELWSFWGNTPRDWARWYRHSRSAPLDLVLDGDFYNYSDLDDDLCDTLEDRVHEDTIRSIHLQFQDPRSIDRVLGRLTATLKRLQPNPSPSPVNCEELRSNSLESLVLCNRSYGRSVDASDFFAHYHLPKLQRLDLINCKISSWDHLTSRTSVLVTLKLDLTGPLPIPTTSQLLSIISSNPALQRIELFGRTIPNDGGGESSSRVQLHHLKEIRLGGDLRHVLNFLDQLDHPRNMDVISLTLHGCNVLDISLTIGPYLRDHLQRRDRCQDGLNLAISSGDVHHASCITIQAGDAGGTDFSTPSRLQISMFVEINVVLRGAHYKDVMERAALDLTSYIPREEVVHFRMSNKLAATLDTYTQFPNLRALSFDTISLTAVFPNLYLVGDEKILPSLEYISLDHMVVDKVDWSRLVTFLAYRAYSGNKLGTLTIAHSPHICPKVINGIRNIVQELRVVDQSLPSPSHKVYCSRD